ncbi:MAG: hypothetical protein CVT48_04335 [Thermoplasmata archaeon HGW-Thermoplasmata-1]|nr:MAG: hypothetical protein CVT48_04335 [Thermoplasmata archaeon HGW-Thermoplasmata-1]
MLATMTGCRLAERIAGAAKLLDDAFKNVPSTASVRVVSHYDADGIAAAGILCNALVREGRRFHCSMIKGLSPNYVKSLAGESSAIIIFADMGSSLIKEISELGVSAIILDHHRPVEDEAGDRHKDIVHVNAHICGIDGTYGACASTLAYRFAEELDKHNIRLAPLALAGAVGDRQDIGGFSGYNKEVYETALGNGFLARMKGIKLPQGELGSAVERSTDPYLVGYSGKKGSGIELLKKLGIKPGRKTAEMTAEEREKLSSFIVTELIGKGTPADWIKEVSGEMIYTDFMGCGTLCDLADTLNACGRTDRTAIALAALMGDSGAISEAFAAKEEYNAMILDAMTSLEKTDVVKMGHLQYFTAKDDSIAGVLAGLAINYLFDPALPILALSRVGDKVKVSARATKPLVSSGCDLAASLSVAAEKFGGYGGGHPIAAGATIPANDEATFLKEMENIIASQMGGKK